MIYTISWWCIVRIMWLIVGVGYATGFWFFPRDNAAWLACFALSEIAALRDLLNDEKEDKDE